MCWWTPASNLALGVDREQMAALQSQSLRLYQLVDFFDPLRLESMRGVDCERQALGSALRGQILFPIGKKLSRDCVWWRLCDAH